MRLNPGERRRIIDVLLSGRYSKEERRALIESILNLLLKADQEDKPDLYGNAPVLVRR